MARQSYVPLAATDSWKNAAVMVTHLGNIHENCHRYCIAVIGDCVIPEICKSSVNVSLSICIPGYRVRGPEECFHVIFRCSGFSTVFNYRLRDIAACESWNFEKCSVNVSLSCRVRGSEECSRVILDFMGFELRLNASCNTMHWNDVFTVAKIEELATKSLKRWIYSWHSNAI